MNSNTMRWITAGLLTAACALGSASADAQSRRRPPASAAETTEAATPDPAPGAVLDINTATATELATLPGIGPSKAQAIVSFRERRRFERVEDILRVQGIGRATFRNLRERLTVSATSRSPQRRGR